MKLDMDALTGQIAEVSDTYARTFGFVRNDDWYLLKLQEEMGELTQSYLKLTGRARAATDGEQTAFAEELADVVCHALLVADHFGVDITEVIQKKWLSRLETPCTTAEET